MRNRILGLLVALIAMQIAMAQRDFSDVEITSEQLSANVYALFGAGGNIGLAIGETEAFVIDDQFGPLTDKIIAHVKTITEKPIKFVLNTHWHGDHTGGNLNLAASGAVIIAHENVRVRMGTKQNRGEGRITEASPEKALPVITFDKDLNLHLGNGSVMHAIAVNNAHTDGDVFYYFPEENVLHMGDNFFSGRYPYIDINSGGDIDGLIANVTMALGMVDSTTKIIPGHGPVSNIEDLESYKHVLLTLRKRIVDARNSGKSLEQVQKMNLSKEWDATHGQGFINAEKIVMFIYNTAD
ncbi:MBL fold metallo-hydrolase [Croceivirga sp. JEA036]|uniref:MBL fold metallo-hydrolase n=1 Tax=Croceivirga sp. JEA036 TaxID=2721162 RepID=UPI00143927F0|nr:MBL fold metallo-hydrolase [Croceivirga sp. JEA036]NJB35975.1 MBL fold metallo-hydrolase [Croceivirga sp. JEA036]